MDHIIWSYGAPETDIKPEPKSRSAWSTLTPVRSSQFFRNFASGQLGLDMVEAFVDKLVEFSCLDVPGFAPSFFQLALEQLGEAWRRFFLEQQRYPYKMFNLIELEHDDFLRELRSLQALEASCTQCLDLEFSSVLIKYISEDDQKDPAVLKAKIQGIRLFLRDVTIFSPISADIVECLHGASQSRLHRFRGARPTDGTAQEVVVLDKITSAYGKFKDWMWNQFGDKWGMRRLHAYNQKKGNQYSAPGTVKLSKALTFEDLDKMLVSGNGPSLPRRVSGHLHPIACFYSRGRGGDPINTNYT